MIFSTIRAQVLDLDGPITPERIANLLGKGNDFYARRSASDLINSLQNDKLLIEKDGRLYAIKQVFKVLPAKQKLVRPLPDPVQPAIATVDNVQLTKNKYGTVVKFRTGLGLPVTKTLATVFSDSPAIASLRLFNGIWLESISVQDIISTVVDAWNVAKRQEYEHEITRIQTLNQRTIKRQLRR